MVATAVSVQDGKYAEAEKELPATDQALVFDFWRATISARIRLNQKDPTAAFNLLKPFLGNPALVPVDFKNKNQDFYRRLYRDALETAIAADASSSSEWSRRLWSLFPDFEKPVSPAIAAGVTTADKIQRLHILSQASLFDTIPVLISVPEISASDLPPPQKCRALFEWGTALRKLGRKDEAVTGFDAVDLSGCEGKLRTRALYWKGVTESDLNRDDAAEAAFEKLAQHPDDVQYADDAYYRLYGLYRQSQPEKSARALQNLLKLSEGDMKEKYLWDAAFAAYQAKDDAKALGFLDDIIAMHGLGTEAQPQALYWKARILEKRSGKKSGGGSADFYAEILKSYPFSFYAMLAELRLGKSAAMPPLMKNSAGFPPDQDAAEILRVVDRLNEKKDHASSADVMDYLTYTHPDIARTKPELLAQRWNDSGDPHRTLEMTTEALDVSVFDIRLKNENPLSRFLYPVGYEDEVKRAASATHLPMGLILGIMREESLFARAVRSRAGAVGLMQLMPGTAKMKAKALSLPFSLSDLSVPASNIRLGSSFLSDMVNRFDGQVALAVMAYNAGPGNVSKWLSTQGYLPMDEFIESIPFSETRGYVKRVLRSARIYGHILGQSKSIKPFKSLETTH